MVRKGDYERVNEYLTSVESDIEFEYGKKFEQLDDEEREQALLDIFFNGNPQYMGSARELKEGIEYTKETGESDVTVGTIRNKRTGRERRVIRDKKTGRFRQWVRKD